MAILDTLMLSLLIGVVDVSEWEKVYPTCNPLKPRRIGALSPVALPHRDKAIKVNDLETALNIYNNAPTFGYRLSYQFPRDKRCTSAGIGPQECLIMKSLGLLRAVVLTVDRLGAAAGKYQVDPVETYASITGAGYTGERYFTEAVFLGSPEGSNSYRSTHTIDGKRFPMEIYMYFEDPTFPGVHGATQLVVLVEESTEDNNQVKPLVAVIDELRKQEKIFLNNTLDLAKLELEFRQKSKYPRVKFPFRDDNGKMTGEFKDEKDMMYFATGQDLNWFRNQQIEMYDHDFTFAESELEREQKYYEAESNYQAAKWVEKHEEFVLENLDTLRYELPELIVAYIPALTIVDEIILKYKKCEAFNLMQTYRKVLQNATSYNRLHDAVFFASDDVNKERKMWENKLQVAKDKLFNCTKSIAIFKNIDTNEELILSENNARRDAWGLMYYISRFFKFFGFEMDVSYPYTKSAIRDLLYRVTEPNLKRRRKQEDFQDFFRKNLKIFTKEQVADLKNIERVAVKVLHRFQISWLMPKSGGYYKYIGATPFPPCITVPETIVFEHSIKMSKAQIASLSHVPHLNALDSDHVNAYWQDIHNTLPPVHLAKDLKIKYNWKSHQFRRFDKVHDDSNAARRLSRKDNKRQLHKSKANPRTRSGNILSTFPALLILIVQLFA